MVGAALAVFVVALDIVPRLARLTGTQGWRGAYEAALAVGAVAAAATSIWPLSLRLPPVLVALLSLAIGAFVGLVAAALTEVVGVLPILSRRVGLRRRLGWLVLALVVGKTVGSLAWWAVPSLWGRPPV